MKVTNINILFIPISGKNEVLSVIPELIYLFGPIMSEIDLALFVYLVLLDLSWPSSLIQCHLQGRNQW